MKKISRWEIGFLIALFLFSVAVRWYRLDHNLFFGFEQGRDAQIIENIYLHHEFKLVGPKTDLAGIFHGAYYYYVMVLPSWISHGNPLVLSFWLVFLSSFVPVIMYFFAKDFWGSKKLGVVAAILTAMSYEYIIYARWLSNVTLAIPFLLFTFFCLWFLHVVQKPKWFIAAVLCAAIAAQFEIVLVLLFGFVFVVLFLLRFLPRPNFRTLLITAGVLFIIFAPHILFNFRNQNVIAKAIVGFAIGHNQNSPIDFGGNFHFFLESYMTVFRKALSLPNNVLVLTAAVIITLVGLFQAARKKKNRLHLLFLLVWFLMAAPVIFFHDVARLTQLYLGIGLSVIFLFVFALRELWSNAIGKGLCILAGFIVLFGWFTVWQNLNQNKDVFFITIQEGMNYHDQIRLLQYAHTSANGQPYRLEAYTIPYLQPEGWQYLQQYLYPNVTDNGNKLVFVVIEKQVDPFWEKKWLTDLGPSQLLEEKIFGLLRLQKRMLK